MIDNEIICPKCRYTWDQPTSQPKQGEPQRQGLTPSELEQAVWMANRALDVPYADPDSDICIISRQFLRALEREAALAARPQEQASQPQCWHKEIDDETGICKACGAKAAIKLEGLRAPSDRKKRTVDLSSVQDAATQEKEVKQASQPAEAQDIEVLAAKFHEIYQAEAKRQGAVRHKDAYADLPENIKEFDRVLARYVIGLLEQLLSRDLEAK